MCSVNMIRYKATSAYDGTHFSGFQVQPNERTIQGELETALTTINKGKFIRIHPSGRTDAGAHALGMVFHFDFSDRIPQEGLLRAMNTLIPTDILIKKLEPVSNDFHARYTSSIKTYTYRINNNRLRNPFTRNFTYHHPYKMDLQRTRKALSLLTGTHDFTSFCSTKSDKEIKVRTLYKAEVDIDEETNEWIFTFQGDGFLYNMIRIIIGTVLPIADGRQEVETLTEILQAKDRNQAGPTISASGLCLKEVNYGIENKRKKY